MTETERSGGGETGPDDFIGDQEDGDYSREESNRKNTECPS